MAAVRNAEHVLRPYLSLVILKRCKTKNT